MSVYADTPRWPQHGTIWGHLISDTSLEELHTLAARAGLPPRSFDLDHYDWPEEMRERLLAAGAHEIGNGELTRRLIASGLRVPLVDRPAARRERSEDAARALALPEVPTELIDGSLGHVQPLPGPDECPPGSFRMTCTAADGTVHIQAHDGVGQAGAEQFRQAADRSARDRGEAGWTGQVLQLG